MNRTELLETGWNTWNPDSLGSFAHRPSGLQIDLILEYREDGTRLEEVHLPDISRSGAHAADGSYISYSVSKEGVEIDLEACSAGDVLVIGVTACTDGLELNVIPSLMAMESGGARGDASSVLSEFRIEVVSEGEGNIEDPLPLESAETVFVYAGPKSKLTPSMAECGELITAGRRKYDTQKPYGSGLLESIPSACRDVVAWNYEWHRPTNRTVIPETREFFAPAPVWGGYIMGCWDTFFQAILSHLAGNDEAQLNVRTILEEITPEGFVPNVGTGIGPNLDRSQPAVGSMAVWKTYRTFGDQSILDESYPKLLWWHRWWFTRRDGNQDGLLEWGSHTFDTLTTDCYLAGICVVMKEISGVDSQAADHVNTMLHAAYESGLDNSQMWDGVVFNREKGVMELNAVDVNSYYALDAWCLARIATKLGRESEAKELTDEFESMKSRINEELWDEEQQLYANQYWDGTLSKRMSPTCFLPMIAGVATPDRAEAMVEHWLLNEEKYWGSHMLSVTPFDDPAVKDNVYWRGRIWGSINYLVYEGLKRYGFDVEAAEFAKRSLETFRIEFDRNTHIHENYNAFTGEGCGVPTSSPFYTWGALLPFLAIQECVDCEFWSEGIRFGSLGQWEAGVENIRYGKHEYRVEIGSGLSVSRDGKPLISCDGPMIVRDLTHSNEEVSFHATVDEPVTLTMYGFESATKMEVLINNVPAETVMTGADGTVVIQSDATAEYRLRRTEN